MPAPHRGTVPERPAPGSEPTRIYHRDIPRLPAFLYPVTSQDDLARKIELLARRDLYRLPEQSSPDSSLPVSRRQ
jgi:hypothetical protein